MSGGYFNYRDATLRDEIYGWSETWHNVFEDREISELVWDILDLIHDYDWYVSGDTRRETYLKAKADFKNKWFNNRDVVVKRVVDTAIEEVKAELYETYGIKGDAE